MPTSFGEPLTKLRAVPIDDNGETLVDPRTLSARIRLATKQSKFSELNHRPEVRRSVAVMLSQAAESLPEGLGLEIIEGVRPMSQQRHMYDTLRSEFASKHPEWSKATLHRVTNQMSAPPDDKCPPPHTTGGAVDVCLYRVSDGEWLDMNSPFPWDETCAPTNLPGLSAEAASNRRLLIDALTPTGLTNYIGEWWHWSYGDSGWALRTGAPNAVYGSLDELSLS